AGIAVLGRKLMAFAEPGEAVGVMLPNANGAAVTILALMSAGRIPAMINFSSGASNIRAACRAAKIKTVVTSRAFIDKARLAPLVAQTEQDVRLLYPEDGRETVSFGDGRRGLLASGKPLVEQRADEPAAILFTSGSEGTPKGVVLSHRNI